MSSSDTRITIKHRRGGSADLVRLSGVLDERFDREKFVGKLKGSTDPFVVDFDRVPYITSFGVREWLRALSDVEGRQAYFVRCRPAVANQFNMIADFSGGGALLSFYCPYLCDRCEESFEVLFDLRFWDRAPVEFADMPQRCPKCKRNAEFDDLPDAYFAFVSANPRPRVPAGVSELLDKKQTEEKTKKRMAVAKELDNELTALWISGGMTSGSRLTRAATGLEGLVLLILEGVEEVSTGGIDALTAVLMQPACEHWLGRVPPRVLTGSLLAELEIGTTKVASLAHRAKCTSCKFEGPVELDREARAAVAKTEKVRCPECGEWANAGKLTPEAKRVRLSEPPAAVASYLEDHPNLAAGPAAPSLESTNPGGRKAVSAPGVALGGPLEKYKIEKRLGFGGMSEVFLGRQIGLEGFEKAVVIKRMLPHLAKNENFVSLFVDEARMAARITHSNVVQIFDLDRVDDTFYIVMELVRGCDLRTVFQLCRALAKPMPIPIALSIVADTCAGLQAAHECTDMNGDPYPIIHRDVSPHNILMSLAGEVKVADFGIAKAVDSQHVTNPGDIKGKTPYLSPELIDGQPATPGADIFATGLVMYAALTLEHPFKRANDTATLIAIMGDEAPAVSTRRHQVPPSVDAVVAMALEKDPAKRFQTARDLQAAIDLILDEIGRPSRSDRALWIRGLLKEARAKGIFGDESFDDLGAMTTTTPARLVGVGGDMTLALDGPE
jgi:serine/threonine protein kinase